LKAAVDGYQEDRDTLENKDPKTAAREDSGLRKFIKFGGSRNIEHIDEERLKDFAKWRKESAQEKSLRKQLTHAKALTKSNDVRFHHGKHFFISGCVMRGVDFKTIALWANHRDGGVLIGTKYAHFASGHTEAQFAKLSGIWWWEKSRAVVSSVAAHSAGAVNCGFQREFRLLWTQHWGG
jgi:hypothetical protein